MIKVNEITLNNSKNYVNKTKNQLNKGTGEILDFEDWNEEVYEGFMYYIIELGLPIHAMNKIKLRNINKSQINKIKFILEISNELKSDKKKLFKRLKFKTSK